MNPILSNINILLILLFSIGLVILAAGIFISAYPREGKYLTIKNSGSCIEKIVKIPFIRKALGFFTNNKNSKPYKLTKKIIDYSETEISVQALYLLKIISLIVISIVFISIKYTNIGCRIDAIIGNPDNADLYQQTSMESQSRNVIIYKEILKSIGKPALNKLNDKKKEEYVKAILPGILKTNDSYVIGEAAKRFVGTYNSVQKITLIDLKAIFIIIISFLLPELLLFLKKLLLSSQHKKEVIRLENVFELLGNANNFKTIDILNEMSKCSKMYGRHLRLCVENFQIDKTMAIDTLRNSIKNRRFLKLVEVIRVYTLVNKKLALDILFRNRMEKEEQILITSQEDVDLVDIIAFISVVPIVYELCNLLVRPMMRMIFDAFKYI